MLPNPIIANKKVNVQFSGYITRLEYPNLRRKLWGAAVLRKKEAGICGGTCEAEAEKRERELQES